MQHEVAANKAKTWLIMGIFLLIIGGLGAAASSLYHTPTIMYGALGGALLFTLMQYFIAAKMALTVNGAKEVTRQDEPRLYQTVERLSDTMRLPMPKVYVMEEPGLNAFATGRDPQHAAVAATRGLLDTMSDKELEGVLAHEMGHVQNYDIRVMMIVFGLVSAIGFLADMLMHSFWFRGNDSEDSSPFGSALAIAAAVLAPFVAMLVQLAVSRRREYLADSTGALTTLHPESLASALEKIAQHGSTMSQPNTSTAHLFFANPLKGSAIAKLFSTHPPIEDRIARLRAMGHNF